MDDHERRDKDAIEIEEVLAESRRELCEAEKRIRAIAQQWKPYGFAPKKGTVAALAVLALQWQDTTTARARLAPTKGPEGARRVALEKLHAAMDGMVAVLSPAHIGQKTTEGAFRSYLAGVSGRVATYGDQLNLCRRRYGRIAHLRTATRAFSWYYKPEAKCGAGVYESDSSPSQTGRGKPNSKERQNPMRAENILWTIDETIVEAAPDLPTKTRDGVVVTVLESVCGNAPKQSGIRRTINRHDPPDVENPIV